MSHRRFITALWVVVAVLVGAVLLPLLVERDQSDPDTVALLIFSMAVLLFAGYRIVQDWRGVFMEGADKEPASKIARETLKAGMPDTAPPEPSDAAGLQQKLNSVFERVPLEQQIGEFAAAGLSLLPGRTIDELISTETREAYENDPYRLLLSIYATDVEGDPRDRWYTAEGFAWDTECINEPGDYAKILRYLERLTGEDVFTTLSDDAQFADSGTATITYAIKGGEVRQKAVKLNRDWADTEAVFDIMDEIEAALNDGRKFHLGDSDAPLQIFFLTQDTANALNKLRPGLLM